jgi:hypothetical protein
MQRHIAICAVVLLALCGCSRQEGPKRFNVHGKLTLAGKECPLGTLFFIPDTQKGGSGPGGFTKAVKGEYRTEPGKGVTPGPHKVEIAAFDGIPNESSHEGNPLTSKVYTVEVNIPAEDCEFSFDVPASHLAK